MTPTTETTTTSGRNSLLNLPPPASPLWMLNGALKTLVLPPSELRSTAEKALATLMDSLSLHTYVPPVKRCPSCGRDVTSRHTCHDWGSRPKTIRTSHEVILSLSVKRRRCACGRTFSVTPTGDLTLPKGRIDLSIVNVGCLLYFGGCSYEYTRDVLAATFGVRVAKRTVQNWVRIKGLAALRTNKSVLTRVTAKRAAVDEQYFTLRVPGGDTTACVTLTIDLEENLLLDISVVEGRQTNYLVAKSALKSLEGRETELVVTDGNPAYGSAVKEALPTARHQVCLQHRVRNVRKKRQVKKLFRAFKESVKRPKEEEFNEVQKRMREVFEEELKRKYGDGKRRGGKRKGVRTSLEKEVRRERKKFEKEQERKEKAFKQRLEAEVRKAEAMRHRMVYAGHEAAEVARLKELGYDPWQEKTTAKLEGNNRVMRTRERKALCFRSPEMVKALYGLYGLYHNTVGVGKGCIYELKGVEKPGEAENLFYAFEGRRSGGKQTEGGRRVGLEGDEGVPIKVRERKYRQERSKQITQLNMSEVVGGGVSVREVGLGEAGCS